MLDFNRFSHLGVCASLARLQATPRPSRIQHDYILPNPIKMTALAPRRKRFAS
jgi:hypothetical protein